MLLRVLLTSCVAAGLSTLAAIGDDVIPVPIPTPAPSPSPVPGPVPTPVPDPIPDPIPDPGAIQGELITDPGFIYEFDGEITDATTADDICQMFAAVVKGNRNPISSNVKMEKEPKVGDTVEINWKTPAVTIKIKGKLKSIDQDGLATISVTEITGEYKGVIAGLELNQDWSINMTW